MSVTNTTQRLALHLIEKWYILLLFILRLFIFFFKCGWGSSAHTFKNAVIEVCVCVSICYMPFSMIAQLTRAGCCDGHFTYFPTPVPDLTIPNDCNLIPSGHRTRHGRAAEINLKAYQWIDKPRVWLELATTSMSARVATTTPRLLPLCVKVSW